MLWALFINLVGLMMTLFGEKMLISHWYICGLMPNLIKKSCTVSNRYARALSAAWSFCLEHTTAAKCKLSLPLSYHFSWERRIEGTTGKLLLFSPFFIYILCTFVFKISRIYEKMYSSFHHLYWIHQMVSPIFCNYESTNFWGNWFCLSILM